jgi:hypothetical protein
VLGLTRSNERESLRFSPGHVRRLVRAAGVTIRARSAADCSSEHHAGGSGARAGEAPVQDARHPASRS